MMTVEQERRALAVKAQQYQQAMRRKLESIIKPGKGNGSWMGPTTPQFGYQGPAHATNLQFGQQISDRDVQEFIKKSGGSPYARQLADLEAKVKQSAATPRLPRSRAAERKAEQAIQQQQGLIQQLAAQYQNAQDEANFQNQMRYDEVHGERSGLRDRNQGRVKNWGIAAKDDLEERFSTNLANVTAGLSSRGLGNSTITSAFEAKNARDLAREQQRLSEMRDDRASRYDTQDTDSLASFVERRNDIAPDMSQLYNLANQYGASGAGGQSLESLVPETPVRRGAPQTLSDIGYRRPQMGMNLPYAVSGNVANRIQGSVNGAYPSTQQMMNPIQNFGPMQSNQMPTPRQTNPEQEWNDLQSMAANTQAISSRRKPQKRTIVMPLQYGARR